MIPACSSLRKLGTTAPTTNPPQFTVPTPVQVSARVILPPWLVPVRCFSSSLVNAAPAQRPGSEPQTPPLASPPATSAILLRCSPVGSPGLHRRRDAASKSLPEFIPLSESNAKAPVVFLSIGSERKAYFPVATDSSIRASAPVEGLRGGLLRQRDDRVVLESDAG